MIDFLQKTIAEGSAFTYLEIIGVIAALLYIYLAAQANAYCFIFGFISSLIYSYICYEYKLYFDSIINSYYLIMSVVGWYFWKSPSKAGELQPTHLKKALFVRYIILGLLLSLLLGYFAYENTNASVPYLDAFTTVFAILATWLVVKKQIENWLIWIVVDALSIGMYFYKELYFTSFLFLVYTIIAVRGYFLWKRKIA